MSISTLTSATSTLTSQSSQSTNPIAQDFKALSTAISQGDTTSAQTALTALQKDLANSPGGAPAADSPLGKALAQLQNDLKTGNTDSLKTDLSTLLQTARKGHHHRPPPPPSTSGDSSSSSAESTSSTSTSVEVPSQSTAGSVLDATA